MNLKVKQSNSFKRGVKKLSKQHKILLDNQIKTLLNNPLLGEKKKGDLDFLRVYKFKLDNQEVLLGYMYEENELTLTLLNFGSHEYFIEI